MFRLDTPGPVEPLTGRAVQPPTFNICTVFKTLLYYSWNIRGTFWEQFYSHPLTPR
jgi:hypothetical protein